MGWWKKLTKLFSKDESVSKIEVDKVTYIKSKEKILEEEMEKAAVSLKPLDDAVERGVVTVEKPAKKKSTKKPKGKSTKNKKPKYRHIKNKRKR